MKIQFILNNGDPPASKLAEVEIHFEEGCLSGLKLLGCSFWHTKKGQRPTVLVPCRSYATAGGVRYYELLRGSIDENDPDQSTGKVAVRRFKDYVRDEYQKIAGLPVEAEEKPEKAPGRKKK